MSQNYVDVTIGGKNYRLAASDKGPEFVTRIADYIDKKLADIIEEGGPSITYKDTFPILFALNIAEDLFGGKDALAFDDTAQREAELQKEIDALNGKLDFYREQDNKNKVRWDELIHQLQTSAAENKRLKEEIEEARSSCEAANSSKDSLEKELDEKNAELEAAAKKNSDKNQELNNLSLKLAEKNRILNELNTKSAERNQKLNAVNKERDELAIKLKECKLRISELEKQQEELEAKMQMGSKGYTSLQKEKTELDREISDIAAENAHLKAACEALQKENAKLSEDYKALKAGKKVNHR
ncbi:MAG: cell division protein ZapA [Firmicutes bacterium]|nr:cell division protein ZapA [Bacillota bacterium]